MCKENIRIKFNAACNSYENVASIQLQSAEILVDYLRKSTSNSAFKTILDLGTGTGYLAELLSKCYPYAIYTLNDISPNMLEKARSKFDTQPNFFYLLGDIEKIDYAAYDLIISNFAFQWLENFEDTILKLYQKARVLAFSCLLDGTFHQWQQILSNHIPSLHLKNYPTEGEIIGLFKQNEICYKTQDFLIKFNNGRNFMLYLKSLGASASTADIDPLTLAKIIKKIDTEFTISYKVFWGIIQK